MTAGSVYRAALGTVLMATILALCSPLRAGAAFGPIELVSKSPKEQAAVAAEPAISADGRYIAFCAELGGREGIFREELETDRLIAVAVGPTASAECSPRSVYASRPSISADGRYVSFTTKEPLVGGDQNGESDVYVADMSTTPPTYELASVADDSEEPLPGGSLAAGRDALSANGDRVAFVNRGNVYVRDLAADETILISARRDPLTGQMEEEKPVEGGGAYEAVGASISADGSTVAWVGEHLPEQVPLIADEEARIKRIEASGTARLENQYHEPLWRRVPSSLAEARPTRRIVGGGDPQAPGCGPSSSIKEPQCQGPYPNVAYERLGKVYENNGYGWGIRLPQLDADGGVVAFAGDPGEQYDLFVVDMEEGLDRDQAVHQVTRWTNPVPQTESNSAEEVIGGTGAYAQYLPFSGAVEDCAISPDGTRIAFVATRQHFSLAPYTLVSELPAAVSLLAELYEVNLEADTIERATPAPGPAVSLAKSQSKAFGAESPSFGAGDRLIAFASEAENLVADDANEHSDAFVIESPPPAPTGTSAISPRPSQAGVEPTWRMSVNAYSRPDGSVRIRARVPGSGTLHATARAQLGSRLKSRRVAFGRRRSSESGMVVLDLRLGSGRRVLARKPGLVTRIHLIFTGPGGQPLQADLQSRFVVHHSHRRKKSLRGGAHS